MSWSVSAKGTPEEVGKALEDQYKSVNLESTPSEQSIFEAAKIVLTNAILGQDPAAVLEINAFGSQSTYYKDGEPSRITNTLKIGVQPAALEQNV
jgi:hypothetical protein